MWQETREYQSAQRIQVLCTLPGISKRTALILGNVADAKFFAEARKYFGVDLVQGLFLPFKLSTSTLDFLPKSMRQQTVSDSYVSVDICNNLQLNLTHARGTSKRANRRPGSGL